jgi:hypothetical protein
MSSMNQADRDYLTQSIGWAKWMLRYGSIALILALCIRFFYEETIGLILVFIGAALYFLSPSGLASLTMGSLAKNPIYQDIVNDIALVGLFCLVPGCALLVRDVIMRITNRFSAAHMPQTDEERARAERLRKHRKPYEKCWDMSVCNERAKRFCPAWEEHKPCWQVKSGCLCDEGIMRKALLDHERQAGIAQQTPQAVDTRPKVILTAQQKKARCRNCTIYAEHQRQKFRIASPATLVLVAAVYAALYGQVHAVLYDFFKRMDRFMSFLTYHKGASESFSTQGNTVTTLGMICLGIVLLSITFRMVEWLIFDRHL